MINLTIEMVQGGVEVGWPPVKQGSVTSHGSEAQILRDLNSFAIAVYDERPDIYNVVVGRFLADYLPAQQYHYTSHMFHQGSGYGSYRGQWDYNATWIFDTLGQKKIFGDDQQYGVLVLVSAPSGRAAHARRRRVDEWERDRCVFERYEARVMMLAANYYKDPYLKQEAMRSNSYLQNFAYGHGNTSPVEFFNL